MLDALRKPLDSNMSWFGLVALDRLEASFVVASALLYSLPLRDFAAASFKEKDDFPESNNKRNMLQKQTLL